MPAQSSTAFPQCLPTWEARRRLSRSLVLSSRVTTRGALGVACLGSLRSRVTTWWTTGVGCLGGVPDLALSSRVTTWWTTGVGCLGGVLPVRPRPPASALYRPARDREEAAGCFIGSTSALPVTIDRAGRTDDHLSAASGLRAWRGPTPPSAAALGLVVTTRPTPPTRRPRRDTGQHPAPPAQPPRTRQKPVGSSQDISRHDL
jgi:hypothetical protein